MSENKNPKPKTQNPTVLKTYLSIVLCCIFLNVNGQDIIYKESFNDNYENSIIKKLYPQEKNLNKEFNSLYTQKTKENINLYFIDTREIVGFSLNKDFQMTSHIRYQQEKKLLPELLGGVSKDSIDILYFSNNNKSNFQSLTINYITGNSFLNDLEINLGDQKILETFTYDTNFYILTTLKKSSILRLHKVTPNKHITAIDVNFSDVEFLMNANKVNLYDYIKGLTCKKINDTDDFSIQKLHNQLKLYIDKNQLYLTLDNYNNSTRLFQINLDNYEKNYIKILNSKSKDENEYVIKSNSFYKDHKIFQIKGNSKNIIIYVYDLLKNEYVKKLLINKNTTCEIENLPLREISLDMNFNLDHLEKKEKDQKNCSKKMKNIINADCFGLTVSDIDNDYYKIHIGGHTYQKGKVNNTEIGVLVGVMAVGMIATGGGLMINPSPGGYYYYPYYISTSGLTEIIHSTLSKESLENVKDNPTKDKNEKFKTFIDEINVSNLQLSDVVSSDNKLIFCYYHPKEKTFYIRKFE